MMVRSPAVAALLAALALGSAVGCAAARLPGTEIPSTPETRGVRDTLESYRVALEKRDAAAVLALAAPEYYDTAGTADPADDLDRATLEKHLPKDLAALEALKVTMTLRRVDLDEKGTTAQAEVFFEQFYRVQTPNGLVARRDADVQRFRLKRAGEKWLFLSGL
jgi:hypothetical protein